MKPEQEDVPPELEHLYGPDEVFKVDASPEQAASALKRGDSQR